MFINNKHDTKYVLLYDHINKSNYKWLLVSVIQVHILSVSATCHYLKRRCTLIIIII